MGSERRATPKAAADRLRKRFAAQEREATLRRARGQEFARVLARRLGDAHEGVEQIIGFDSTFETWRNYRLDSDIDLAFIGGDWFALVRLAEEFESEFEISLIDLNDQNEAFRDQVLKVGEVLYEKR